DTLDAMLDSAQAGCDKLFELQREALAAPYPGELPAPPAARTAGRQP
ncbi:ribonuclease PH, partial [Dietzia sp. Cai40]|nr:ribonuclease PH [Dietzia sp. Cai40]